MRFKGLPRAYALLGLAAAVAVGTLPLAAAPPLVSLTNDGKVLPGNVPQLKARVQYWLDMIRDAKDDRAMLEGRAGLVKDFGMSDNPDFRYTFGSVAGELAPTYLNLDSPARQINVALALSRMNAIPIRPALDLMIVHPNPAVRYLGWEGYRNIRLEVAAHPLDGPKMCAAIAKAAQAETSPLVIGEMFGTLTLPMVPPPSIPPDSIAKARREFSRVFLTVWTLCCRKMLAGDTEFAETCRKGVDAARNFALTPGADPDTTKKMLQALVDMAWCAAKAYDAAGANGPVADAAGGVLMECEAALNAGKNLQRNHLQAPLTDPNVPERGAAVRYGVTRWIDELKADGVVQPDFKAPTTSATSGPAAPPARPATATAPAAPEAKM